MKNENMAREYVSGNSVFWRSDDKPSLTAKRGIPISTFIIMKNVLVRNRKRKYILLFLFTLRCR